MSKTDQNTIIELKSKIADLEKREQQFNSVMNSANMAVISTDKKGTITFWNQTAEILFGYTNKDIIDKPLTILIPKEYRDAHKAGFKNYLATGESKIIGKSVELIGLKKDKIEFPIELSLSSWQTGGETFFTAVIQDITDHKLAEEKNNTQQQQLIQADKMASLGVMVSGVAHEINNPNNFISFNAPFLKRIYNDIVPAIKEYFPKDKNFSFGGLSYDEAIQSIPTLLDGISNGSLRIKRIVDKLKDFAKHNTSHQIHSHDINDIIKKSLLLLDNIIKRSTDNFIVTLDPAIPVIPCNAQEIEQVLVNLIVNSCQSLKSKDKTVSIKTYHSGDPNNVVIEVTDEGKGIPEENIKKIIDPFFTTKRDSGGTGLGLSVSFGIVKQHNGTLKFKSKPGQGTTAVLSLPC